ncbi:hypothetical protein JB92DRAFT_2274185 [Gautieria morchelliformis]|nr:hypothetical protein JB92DRAFT_2274185 [Gautieria morchelliformis]
MMLIPGTACTFVRIQPLLLDFPFPRALFPPHPMYASEASSTAGSVETHVDPAELYLSRIPHLTRTLKPHDDDMGAAFAERQMIHFAKVLGEKWACPREGHNICVTTEDGGHHELSDDNITAWVAALCGGEATTSQPPLNVLLSFVPSAPAPTGPADAPGSPALRAVPPSRRRYNSSNASTHAPYTDLDDADTLFLAPSERESTVLGEEWAHDSPVVPGDGDTRPRERVGANVPSPTRDPTPTPTLSPIPPLSPMSTMSRVATATASSASTPTTNGNAHSRAGSGDSLLSANSTPTPTERERERDVWSPYASFLPSIADGEGDDGQSPSEERGLLQPVQEEAEEQYEDSAPSVPSTPNTPGAAAPPTPPTADAPSHWDVDSQYGTSFARSRPRSEGSDFYYDAARGDALGVPGGGEDGPLFDEGASRWSSQEFERPVGAGGNGVTTEGKKKPFRWFGGKAAVQTSSVTKRANAHVARIKKWQKAAVAYTSASDASHGKNGKNGAGKGGAKGKGKGKGGAPPLLALARAEREAVSEMMADALEMARPSHPPRLHKLAYTIGRDVQQFLTVVLQAMEEGAYGGDESDDADGAELQLLLIQDRCFW